MNLNLVSKSHPATFFSVSMFGEDQSGAVSPINLKLSYVRNVFDYEEPETGS